MDKVVLFSILVSFFQTLFPSAVVIRWGSSICIVTAQSARCCAASSLPPQLPHPSASTHSEPAACAVVRLQQCVEPSPAGLLRCCPTMESSAHPMTTLSRHCCATRVQVSSVQCSTATQYE